MDHAFTLARLASFIFSERSCCWRRARSLLLTAEGVALAVMPVNALLAGIEPGEAHFESFTLC